MVKIALKLTDVSLLNGQNQESDDVRETRKKTRKKTRKTRKLKGKAKEDDYEEPVDVIVKVKLKNANLTF